MSCETYIPKVHVLKLQSQFWHSVMSGVKSFEIRKNDRDFKVGDFIVFKEVWEGEINRTLTQSQPFKIKYILSGWGLEDCYVAIAIERH